MYILRPDFAVDAAAAIAFAATRGFGLLVASGDGRPIGSHLPFTMDPQPGPTVARFHVTRANPLAALADGNSEFLLVVTGADAYVSNDWYASPDHVSTWLYEAVHLSGPAQRIAPSGNRAHGDELLDVMESRLAPKPPWRLATMEPLKREAMLQGIVVIELSVRVVEAQRKLNQHKTDADHVAVVRGLEGSGRAASRDIARQMRELRPHLRYEEP